LYWVLSQNDFNLELPGRPSSKSQAAPKSEQPPMCLPVRLVAARAGTWIALTNKPLGDLTKNYVSYLPKIYGQTLDNITHRPRA